ncbi:MAG: hypothetical protein A3G70_01970 [Planctomycetes bacterium RIFCSPLOWO2_12_FULL_39_13]|nr:MAG: hypothetical protein A3G70_01970 [Planctomycetes bacterium RIFCSPLOWO2_12_FULL_39_13]
MNNSNIPRLLRNKFTGEGIFENRLAKAFGALGNQMRDTSLFESTLYIRIHQKEKIQVQTFCIFSRYIFYDTFRYGVKNKECTHCHWAENTVFAVQNQGKYREYTWFNSLNL